jgi:hypothetical protein
MEQESALVTGYYLMYKQNGSRIALESSWSGNHSAWIVSASGGAPEQPIFHEIDDRLACWSRDFERSAELNPHNANPIGMQKRVREKTNH